MTNFAVGAIFGFLVCVWAIGTAPGTAFSALWARLEQVQEMSATASQAYDAMRPARSVAPMSAPVTQPAPAVETTVYR
jgi:hypothetical protein